MRFTTIFEIEYSKNSSGFYDTIIYLFNDLFEFYIIEKLTLNKKFRTISPHSSSNVSVTYKVLNLYGVLFEKNLKG